MAAITLTSPAASRVYQRDTTVGGFGQGVGSVPLTINATAVTSLVEYQLRDAQTPTTVLVPWTQAATNIPAGTQTLTLNAPARAGWYLIDLRANGDPSTVVSTSNGIGVGEVIAAAGQSLATDFWSTAANYDVTTLASLGVAVSPFCSVLAAWDGGALPSSTTAWAPPADGGTYPSSFAAEFLRLVVNATGVNAALIGSSHSGTDISTYWLPGETDYNRLISVLSTAGAKFGTFLWCQGHNDADARIGAQYHLTPAATYLSYLQTLMGSLVSSFPARAFRRILCSIPAIQPAAAAKFSASGIEAIRGAHRQYVTSDPLSTYVDGLDVPLMSDGIHPSQAGNVIFGRHFYRAFLKGMNSNSAGDYGPAFTGTAFRPDSSPTIVLPVHQAGGNTLEASGDATTQFQIFPSGQVTGALPIAEIDVSQPSQIVLTLASTPASNQALDIWYRLPFDAIGVSGNGIYDNNANDGDGLTVGRQLQLISTPLTAPAPAASWHRPMLISPGIPMLSASGAIAFST